MVKTKAEIRKEMLGKRNAISKGESTEKSSVIRQKLFALQEVKQAKVIAFYLTKGSEVETGSMVDQAKKEGKKVLVPVAKEDIELVEFLSWEELALGKFDILEPTRKIRHDKADVVVTPGIAFDKQCHRIGYGKGYYDKLFKKINTIRIGIAFDFQVIESVPANENDEKLDMVITEKRTIRKY